MTLNTGLVILIWGTLVYKLYALHWRLRDAVQRAYYRTHLLIALTFTVLYPPLYLALDRFVGIPNVARLVGNCLGVVGGYFFQPVTAKLDLAARKGRVQAFLESGWLPAATIAALALLFSRASLPISAPLDFQARYSTVAFMAPYRLVLMLYVGLVAGRVFLLSLRNWEIVEHNPRPYRRVQTHLQTVGWGFCVGYAFQEAAYIGLEFAGRVSPHAYPVALANVCLTGGIVLLLSSALFDTWHWLGQYRVHRRLYPLWRDLYRATPSIALDPPRSAWSDALDMGNLSLRLYRRVVEIRDGMVALEPYVDETLPAAIHDRGFGRRTRYGSALTHAVRLRAAMAAKRAGHTAMRPTHMPLIPPGNTFEEEVRVLERTAIAYRRVKGYVPARPMREGVEVR